MSLPIVIAERAEHDIALQYQWYLEQAGMDVAEGYLLCVDETIRLLADQPYLGVSRSFRAQELQGIRSSQVCGAYGKHLVFYRASHALSIERVMHGARDLPRRLLDRPEGT